MNDELLVCLFTGKCYHYEYDYFVIFNGSITKADYCVESVGFHNSYCVIENKTFYNVKYSQEVVNKEEYTTTPIGLICVIMFIMWLFIKFVMYQFSYKK